jgi:8-oxo-dGTP pyrophosphatase MutT (NUDIX family)
MNFEILIDGAFEKGDFRIIYRPGRSPARDEAIDSHGQSTSERERACEKKAPAPLRGMEGATGYPLAGVPSIEDFIDRTWRELVSQYEREGLKVFDGGLFSLNSYGMEGNKPLLRLGDTSYKEYVGTSLQEFRSRYPGQPSANPLAVCISLVTSDGKIVVEKRRRSDRYRGPYHVIGGFVERGLDCTDDLLPDIFGAIRREVKEELGLSLKDGEIISLGLVRNLVIAHPEVCFFSKIGRTFADVLAVFSGGHVDGEIGQLISVNDDSLDLTRFLIDHHGRLVATGEACLLLYGKHRFGKKWYHSTIDLLLKK